MCTNMVDECKNDYCLSINSIDLEFLNISIIIKTYHSVLFDNAKFPLHLPGQVYFLYLYRKLLKTL